MNVEVHRTRLTARQDRFLPAANRNLGFACAAESLDQGDSAGLCGGFCITGIPSQMRGNGAVDDAQHTAHDGGPAGKQKTQWERYAKHPLTYGQMRENVIYQQGGTVGHAGCPVLTDNLIE